MLADESLSQSQGGSNSLFDILHLNEATDDDIQSIGHSSYYDLDTFNLLAEKNIYFVYYVKILHISMLN